MMQMYEPICRVHHAEERQVYGAWSIIELEQWEDPVFFLGRRSQKADWSPTRLLW